MKQSKAQSQSVMIVIVDKAGTLKSLNVKEYKEEELFKKCGFKKADDFVLATGITTTVREFVRRAFLEVNIEIEFNGDNENEIAKVAKCNGDFKLPIGKVVVEVDSMYYRPTEVDLLVGNATKAKENLGWTPKYDLNMLIKEMMAADLENAKVQH